MPKRTSRAKPRAEETLFDLVTRKDRIEQHAAILCDGWRLRDRGVFLHVKSSVTGCPNLLDGDPRQAVEYYVSRGLDIPLWLGKLILEAGKPKGRAKGRYTNPESEGPATCARFSVLSRRAGSDSARKHEANPRRTKDR